MKREETKRYQKTPDETRRDKKGEEGTGWEQKEPEKKQQEEEEAEEDEEEDERRRTIEIINVVT